MSEEKHLVVGFAFHEDKVVLILKNKPEWMKNLYNGVGGKVEQGEQLLVAMCREFHEETGSITTADQWTDVAQLYEPHYVVHFYATELTEAQALEVRQREAEPVAWVPINMISMALEKINDAKVIPNLLWLVPLARHVLREPKERYATPIHVNVIEKVRDA